MTPEQEKVLDQAHQLQKQISALMSQQDKLLGPIVSEVARENDPNEIWQLIKLLPAGFHRSELRTLHIERLCDFEYRRRFKPTQVKAQTEDCKKGIHSWSDMVGKLPPDFPCAHCGELYGDPT